MTRGRPRKIQTAPELQPLREWLSVRGMSEGQFAKAIRMDPGLMSKVFSGQRPMGLACAFRAALLTGFNVEDLIISGETQRLLKLYGARQKAEPVNPNTYVNVAEHTIG